MLGRWFIKAKDPVSNWSAFLEEADVNVGSRFNLISKNKNQQFQNYLKHVHFYCLFLSQHTSVWYMGESHREPPANTESRKLKRKGIFEDNYYIFEAVQIVKYFLQWSGLL